MANYSISFKIDDFLPKIKSISYNNYMCLLLYEDFQIRMPLSGNEYNKCEHILRKVKSDLYYKITIFDNKAKTIIGVNDFIIPYKLLHKINSNESYIYKKEIKFIISNKAKMHFLDSQNNDGKIILYLSSKIFKKQKNGKNIKKTDKLNNKFLSPAITERASFIQKINRNLIKAKFVISKNKVNKNKERYFSSESNKLISTNDLSGNIFNTYSNIDENENNNTNNYINNISSINNIINQNYYCFNTTTSEKEEFKNNKNNIYNIYNLDIDKKKYNHKKNINQGNELFGIRNILKKRFQLSKANSFNKEENKYSLRNHKKNIPYKNIIIKSKTRHSFNAHLKTKNGFVPYSDDESNSLKIHKNKIIKSKNEERNYNSCESYSNKPYLKTETRKIKMKSIIGSFIQENIEYKNRNRNRNKFMPLSKDKKDKYLDTKNKFITENLLNKACLTHKLSMIQNLKENKSQKKIKQKRNNINKIKNASLSKIYINKSNKLKDKKENHNKNTDKNCIINNNIKIKVRRKNKNKNNNKANIENYKSNQIELYKNEIKICQYFILNNKNIKSINIKLKEKHKKLIQTKEIFFTLLKKSNRLKENKSYLHINNFILNTIKNNFNKKIKINLINVKNKEFEIYKKIFDFFICENEINKYLENEKNIEEKLFKLQLSIIKNLIKHYGNISQIYINDISKKEKLKNILYKNNIVEKERDNKNNFIDLVTLNKINTSVKNIIKSTFNKDVKYSFNIIKEVQEEKESEKNSNIYNKVSSISNLMNDINDISDEILFIDKKESDINEGNVKYNKNKNTISSINYYRNDYSNSLLDNSSKKKEYNNEKNIKKNIRKELIGIGINKKKFKGKDLNLDEFGIDYYDNNKIRRKENIFKIGFFTKKSE